jgi:heme/copper-type cytochrome/quinol oxidase subunit 1
MPTHRLFLLLAIVESILALLADDNTHTISLHDSYLVIAQAHVRWGIAILALLFAGSYLLMERTARPISPRVGMLHFGLIVLGLLLPSVALVLSGHTGDPVRSIMVLSGMLLLVAGLLVFVVGLVAALWRSRLNA